jgi:hypothetical protein
VPKPSLRIFAHFPTHGATGPRRGRVQTLPKQKEIHNHTVQGNVAEMQQVSCLPCTQHTSTKARNSGIHSLGLRGGGLGASLHCSGSVKPRPPIPTSFPEGLGVIEYVPAKGGTERKRNCPCSKQVHNSHLRYVTHQLLIALVKEA